VPGDLDAICRKCLAKPPRRRYASALELAEDLRNCAAGHPVKARGAGNAERLGRWLRRNWRGVALVVLGLCLGAALAGLINADHDDALPPPREHGYRQTISRLESDLGEARRQQSNADYLRYLLLAERAADGGEKERGLEMLERCPAQQRHWEWYYLRGRLQDGNQVARLTTDLPISCMDISPDSRYLAAGGGMEAPNEAGVSKGEVSVWDLTTRKRIWHWPMAGPVCGVAISPHNDYLALIRGSQQRRRKGALEARHLQTGLPIFAPRLFRDCTPTSLAYSADSRTLLVFGDDGELGVLQATNATELQAQEIRFPQAWPPGPHARLVPMSTSSQSNSLALISPDGGQILVLSDLQRLDVLLDFRNHDNTIYSALAYDRQHEKLAAGGTAKEILLWDVRFPHQAPRRLLGHTGSVQGLSFSSDGKRLASCGADGTVRIWDAEHGSDLLVLTGYTSAAGVRFQQMRPPFDDMRSYFGDRLAIAHGNTVTILEPP
jgi:eukaryotic-like serine/threonine-protein kinase